MAWRPLKEESPPWEPPPSPPKPAPKPAVNWREEADQGEDLRSHSDDEEAAGAPDFRLEDEEKV